MQMHYRKHSELCLLLSFALASSYVLGQGTKVGFYSSSCPKAESIIRSTVTLHYNSDPTIAPGLLRLHFHDCFVQGCDGSILITGANAEKNALPNQSLRGFDVIDDAKSKLEAACPGVVSCADIVALAARDSVDLAGGPSWDVPTGRRDGLISSASEASNLPSFSDSMDVLKQKFSQKGLTTKDLVTLVGAHTIGTAQCQFFRYRLYNFTSSGGPDPTIAGSFLPQLRALCPANGDGTKRVALDFGSSTDFDDSIFSNIEDGKGVLESDQKLWSDPATKNYVEGYTGLISDLVGVFEDEFSNSMVKMSNIGVSTGSLGEIRKVCSAFNS